ncbi:MAG: hypothetical protein CVV50_01865 [Spirochaetae bacterium HGW-Spirochaetae-6]|jgi:uncharacterized membrane protein YheB (UPF0754 family)|nr:MAG: hypothetical protein CVV50_01865 [Spirochaetae bacterium HGW-Spirochaetae-6]
MKKIWLFKKKLFTQIKQEGFSFLSARELEGLLEFLLGKKLTNFSFARLAKRGLAVKEALILSCIYEIGKRAAQATDKESNWPKPEE